MKISGNIIDVISNRIFKGEIEVEDKRVIRITEVDEVSNQYILPGFIDAHVHIESSMVVPSEFARMAVVHGTVATVSDPHEIGNVLGVKGVEFMIENGNMVPFKFYFGAPSCVPATSFETAGAEIDTSDVEKLLDNPEIKYLAEMMNWPGVLYGDAIVKAKIEAAKRRNKPVDGHAPGLRGDQARAYIEAGMSTDHECFTKEEALDKLFWGMKILIREGSAAKNFDALVELLHDHSANIMFCSDDKHPDSLELGHINHLVKRALQRGVPLFNVLKAACVNPVMHYNLEVGLLRENDPADFVIVNNLDEWKIMKTFINGELVAENGNTKIDRVSVDPVNHFVASPVSVKDVALPVKGSRINVIEALDGQLITNCIEADIHSVDGYAVSNADTDILKIVVVNRYKQAHPAVAFIKNFGLRYGAIASSVAHDSHNIIAVGVNDELIVKAINLIIKEQGGLSAVTSNESIIIPLPVAGLMSAEDGYSVADAYKKIDTLAKKMGSKLHSPFMTLSFMALLVIPSLKLSDKGLFDGVAFEFKDVFKE